MTMVQLSPVFERFSGRGGGEGYGASWAQGACPGPTTQFLVSLSLSSLICKMG